MFLHQPFLSSSDAVAVRARQPVSSSLDAVAVSEPLPRSALTLRGWPLLLPLLLPLPLRLRSRVLSSPLVAPLHFWKCLSVATTAFARQSNPYLQATAWHANCHQAYARLGALLIYPRVIGSHRPSAQLYPGAAGFAPRPILSA